MKEDYLASIVLIIWALSLQGRHYSGANPMRFSAEDYVAIVVYIICISAFVGITVLLGVAQ